MESRTFIEPNVSAPPQPIRYPSKELQQRYPELFAGYGQTPWKNLEDYTVLAKKNNAPGLSGIYTEYDRHCPTFEEQAHDLKIYLESIQETYPTVEILIKEIDTFIKEKKVTFLYYFSLILRIQAQIGIELDELNKQNAPNLIPFYQIEEHLYHHSKDCSYESLKDKIIAFFYLEKH